MTYKTFYKLCHDAEDAPNEEMFIAEPGWADWMDEYGDDTDKLIADMRNIYTVANMSIRDIIKAAGMTQTAFAERFDIPLRTVQNWSAEHRGRPLYARLMMADLLGLVKVERS